MAGNKNEGNLGPRKAQSTSRPKPARVVEEISETAREEEPVIRMVGGIRQGKEDTCQPGKGRSQGH